MVYAGVRGVPKGVRAERPNTDHAVSADAPTKVVRVTDIPKGGSVPPIGQGSGRGH